VKFQRIKEKRYYNSKKMNGNSYRKLTRDGGSSAIPQIQISGAEELTIPKVASVAKPASNSAATAPMNQLSMFTSSLSGRRHSSAIIDLGNVEFTIGDPLSGIKLGGGGGGVDDKRKTNKTPELKIGGVGKTMNLTLDDIGGGGNGRSRSNSIAPPSGGGDGSNLLASSFAKFSGLTKSTSDLSTSGNEAPAMGSNNRGLGGGSNLFLNRFSMTTDNNCSSNKLQLINTARRLSFCEGLAGGAGFPFQPHPQ